MTVCLHWNLYIKEINMQRLNYHILFSLSYIALFFFPLINSNVAVNRFSSNIYMLLFVNKTHCSAS